MSSTPFFGLKPKLILLGVMAVGMIEPGFCQCGCGEKTKLALETDSERGHVKGQPFRFIHGHAGRVNLFAYNSSRTLPPTERLAHKKASNIKALRKLRRSEDYLRREQNQEWLMLERKDKEVRLQEDGLFIIGRHILETPSFVFELKGKRKFERLNPQ